MNLRDKIFWTEFLKMYESMPCLWKVKSPEYSNRKLKAAAYEKLVQKLKEIDVDATRETVVKKINTFRTNYRRTLKHLKEKSESDTRERFESSLWYYDMLHFLEDQEESNGVVLNRNKSNKNINQERLIQQLPPKKKKPNEEELIRIACDRLKESSDATTSLAKSWASQYAELSNTQKIYARTIFSDVLFHGCLNHLTEQMVENIHNVLIDDTNKQISQNSSYIEEYKLSPPSINDEELK